MGCSHAPHGALPVDLDIVVKLSTPFFTMITFAILLAAIGVFLLGLARFIELFRP